MLLLRGSAAVLLVFIVLAEGSVGDDLLYRYEGDVPPYTEPTGWLVYYPCNEECSDSVDNGHYVLRWEEAAHLVNYNYWIARPPQQAPSSLWVEWRFHSNQPLGPYYYMCDARFSIHYDDVHEVVWMFGDAAISFSGGDFIGGLDIDEFHTYRFETLDGYNYWISVDGTVFIVDSGYPGNDHHYLQFGADGGCDPELHPIVNEWDFIRFGTISHGERIVSSDPPSGLLDARRHAGLDRFAVTFDSPNYVYLDEISVQVTGGLKPTVGQTRRRENDGPQTVEILLDRPIPMGETTRLTFGDGVAVNVIEYTFAPADTDGDGDADLFDLATFQTCFGETEVSGVCQACDLSRNGQVNLYDWSRFEDVFVGP